MSVRTGATAVIACAILSLAACSSSSAGGVGGLAAGGSPSATPVASPAPIATLAVTPTSAAPAPTSAVTTAAPALTCKQLKGAVVGSKAISYNGYSDSIPLGDGRWSGEDGTTVTLDRPCGIGDLDGDGAGDAVGVVDATSGGSGDFYTLVVWRDVNGKPVFTALSDLGDRNPVVSITVKKGKATVVYLTRTSDAPMAEVNLKRTAIYTLSGDSFSALSHSEVPYHEK